MFGSFSDTLTGALTKRFVCFFVVLAFISTSIISPAYAQSVFNLPQPGTVVPLSEGYAPAVVRGLTIHPENALEFNFLIDQGKNKFENQQLRQEVTKLVKYFLAGLTVPEKELWVNLSPYEKDRIVPDGFGQTEMGRDLLAQDYMLKQLTGSVMIPEEGLGKTFWAEVYAQAQEKFGTTDLPMDTFNKIWVVPQTAELYEKGNTVVIVKSHLKVMLDIDYTAMLNNVLPTGGHVAPQGSTPSLPTSELTTQVIREVILPAIEKEVNEGKTFANLRQIYNSVILSVWYKKNLEQSLLNQVYADQGKVKGVDHADVEVNQKIYAQYVEAFKKGVYNLIKEEADPATGETVARKYFTGGNDLTGTENAITMKEFLNESDKKDFSEQAIVNARVKLNEVGKGANPDVWNKVNQALNDGTPLNVDSAEKQDADNSEDITLDNLSKRFWHMFEINNDPKKDLLRILEESKNSEESFNKFTKILAEWFVHGLRLSSTKAYHNMLPVLNDIMMENDSEIGFFLADALSKYLVKEMTPSFINLPDQESGHDYLTTQVVRETLDIIGKFSVKHGGKTELEMLLKLRKSYADRIFWLVKRDQEGVRQAISVLQGSIDQLSAKLSAVESPVNSDSDETKDKSQTVSFDKKKIDLLNGVVTKFIKGLNDQDFFFALIHDAQKPEAPVMDDKGNINRDVLTYLKALSANHYNSENNDQLERMLQHARIVLASVTADKKDMVGSFINTIEKEKDRQGAVVLSEIIPFFSVELDDFKLSDNFINTVAGKLLGVVDNIEQRNVAIKILLSAEGGVQYRPILESYYDDEKERTFDRTVGRGIYVNGNEKYWINRPDSEFKLEILKQIVQHRLGALFNGLIPESIVGMSNEDLGILVKEQIKDLATRVNMANLLNMDESQLNAMDNAELGKMVKDSAGTQDVDNSEDITLDDLPGHFWHMFEINDNPKKDLLRIREESKQSKESFNKFTKILAEAFIFNLQTSFGRPETYYNMLPVLKDIMMENDSKIGFFLANALSKHIVKTLRPDIKEWSGDEESMNVYFTDQGVRETLNVIGKFSVKHGGQAELNTLRKLRKIYEDRIRFIMRISKKGDVKEVRKAIPVLQGSIDQLSAKLSAVESPVNSDSAEKDLAQEADAAQSYVWPADQPQIKIIETVAENYDTAIVIARRADEEPSSKPRRIIFFDKNTRTVSDSFGFFESASTPTVTMYREAQVVVLAYSRGVLLFDLKENKMLLNRYGEFEKQTGDYLVFNAPSNGNINTFYIYDMKDRTMMQKSLQGSPSYPWRFGGVYHGSVGHFYYSIYNVSDMELLVDLKNNMKEIVSVDKPDSWQFKNRKIYVSRAAKYRELPYTEVIDPATGESEKIYPKDQIIDFAEKQSDVDNAALKGGIDLNPALLDMQIKRDGNGVPFPVSQQSIADMKIEGFIPVIINITPVTNVGLLLGFDTTNAPEQQLSQVQDETGALSLAYMREEVLEQIA
jgi:Fe-S cluster assembly iron-binding protein IscA